MRLGNRALAAKVSEVRQRASAQWLDGSRGLGRFARKHSAALTKALPAACRDPQVRAAALHALRDTNPTVRANAAVMLGEVDTDMTEDVLSALLDAVSDPEWAVA